MSLIVIWNLNYEYYWNYNDVYYSILSNFMVSSEEGYKGTMKKKSKLTARKQGSSNLSVWRLYKSWADIIFSINLKFAMRLWDKIGLIF